MSNTESSPQFVDCEHHNHPPTEVQRLAPKLVSLGEGPDAMTVRRILPQLERSFVGAWCFADHYGPNLVEATGGMDVAPHPHTSLQTVSWLFDGEIEHRDSGGVHDLVRPGEVNLMTSGYGISHSEVTTAQTEYLHGVQLWVVLPEHAKDMERGFQHHRPDVVDIPGGRARVMVGELAGATSPITTETGLLGAEIILRPGAEWEFEVRPGFEHGVLVDIGAVEVDGVLIEKDAMGVRDAGLNHLRLRNPTDRDARLMLLGGEPFEEGIVMWWNFIGRSHEEIVELREAWQAGDDRFGGVRGYRGSTQRLEAPPLPATRLKPRFRRRRG
ncbi:MAG TPA: pirin family protein [Arachnia sp.]|nr:pirin family protein [Arachnia sp.]